LFYVEKTVGKDFKRKKTTLSKSTREDPIGSRED